ncbi:PhzF family phenazine biosynthesis protein [Pyruvatibacter sp.]|uniref:PhzF family phenazine biosynthesis protein n=1 Tax=Pyruvatibacter sp. TaxID=1981328 RepID=UPI003264F482
MKLNLFQVDAFAERPFEGNPAAVVPLDTWLSDEQMLAIAAENNLAETAFFVAEEDGYRLRWFTPTLEVELCGHATLATAHVILTRLKPELDHVVFQTRSGTLTVRRGDNGKDNGKLVMDFPARASKPMPIPRDLGPMLGVTPRIVLSGANLIAVFDSAADVARLRPAFEPLGKYLGPRNQGLIATAPGDADSGFDFVSRFFAPSHGVEEDHVTGSAHCDTTPFWAKKLKKNEMIARQISSRGGTVGCRLDGERVYLEGACADYLEGTIQIGDGS